MSDKESNQAIGFLSVESRREHGFFGGLLLVNGLGRPLEFHCTLPIKPSKAQEILYGPTLESFLCGEHIGLALVSKVKTPAPMIFTDVVSALSLRLVSNQMVAWIASDADSEPNLSNACETLEYFEIDGCRAAVLAQFRQDIPKIQERWNKCPPNIDLREPFGRIHDALMEANPNAKAA